MASVFKKKGKWYYAFFDFSGNRVYRRGLRTAEATRQLAEKTEDEVRQRQLGLIDPTKEKIGENTRIPIAEHLEDFQDWLEGKGKSEIHVVKTVAYIEKTIAACGFKIPADLEASRLAGYLAELRREGKCGVRVINARLTAMKYFGRWLYENNRAWTDPFKTLKIDLKNQRNDKKHPRRVLDDEEISRLIQAARTGPTYRKMTGPMRATVYDLALGTGFRRGELSSLTPADFDLSDLGNATVTVLGAYAKNRTTAVQPIREDLARRMAAFIAGSNKANNDILFPLPDRTSTMIHDDLDQARAIWIGEARNNAELKQEREKSDFLKFKDSAGRIADFHALRHTFITRLTRSGVSPKVAQTLARHSTITLTMDNYSHTYHEDQRAALDKLPGIDLEAKEVLQATGTDGKSAQNDPKREQQGEQQLKRFSGVFEGSSDHEQAKQMKKKVKVAGTLISGRTRPSGRFCAVRATPVHEEISNGRGQNRTDDLGFMNPFP